jgi:ribonuclease HI
VKATLYTDGGARGNPGPAAAAYVLEAEDRTLLDAQAETIGIATNNIAEYRAVINGLRKALELGVTELDVRSDSELLVRQMNGEYRVKNPTLQKLSLEVAALVRQIGRVAFTAVRRERNTLADSLVNEALDRAG